MTFLHVTHDRVPGELSVAQDARYRQADASKADEAKAAARSRARAVAARLAASKPPPPPADTPRRVTHVPDGMVLSAEEVHLLDHLLRTHPDLWDEL